MNVKILSKTVCVAIALQSFQAYSCNIDSFKADESIPVRPITNQNHNQRPHSRALIPFELYYSADISSILLYFIADVGEVEISIHNLSSGEYNDYTVNSKVGSVVLPITGDSGYYVITFTLQNGKQFIGEFSI